MKKYYFLLTMLTWLGTGCGDQFLDLAPPSQASSDDFYKTAEDIEKGLIGAYDALQATGQYGRNFVYFMEVPADNATVESTTTSGGIYGDFDLFRVVPSNALLAETWKHSYVGIQRCNIILNRMETVSMDNQTKEIRKGEAKFLRALTYFNLVRIWGPVPMVTEEVKDPFAAFNHTRNPEKAIYDQIIQDLQEAILVLPPRYSGNDIGRVTKIAAQALLGKVYLTRKNYLTASEQLKAVIDYAKDNPAGLGLLPVYADIFKTSNKNNKESIFEVQFLKGGFGEGSEYVNRFAPLGSTQLTGGVGVTVGDNVPTRNLLKTFAPNDQRKLITIDSLAGVKGRFFTRKFEDKPFQDGDASTNFIVLRYADVLLMYAEALNEIAYSPQGDAFISLNTVRDRADIATFTAQDLPGQESFREAVAEERRRELAFENHRWFDLTRTGKAREQLNVSGSANVDIKEHQLLFPIPQNQIDTNPGKIYQNPEY